MRTANGGTDAAGEFWALRRLAGSPMVRLAWPPAGAIGMRQGRVLGKGQARRRGGRRSA